jgi:hypothetical protein
MGANNSTRPRLNYRSILAKKIMSSKFAWLFPQGREIKNVLGHNRAFRNIHAGKRCFILGTGPSINKQNLIPLKDELCISLNFFYYHRDYHSINPRYSVVSGLHVHPIIPDETGLKWFQEIERKITSTDMFFNYFDRQVILENNLFKNRKVHYLHFTSRLDDLMRDGIDATKPLYPFQSVSVAAIQLAIYMGFKEIYLLGLDHDWILRFPERLPTHFYQPPESILEKNGLIDWAEEEMEQDLEQEFYNHWILWHQYKCLKRFAGQNRIGIYNATDGGLLDVFKRVDYDALIKGPSRLK